MSANVRWKETSPTPIVAVVKLEFLLPHCEDRSILSSFVRIGYQRVTDRRTDRQRDGRTDGIAVGNTALCIASKAAAL